MVKHKQKRLPESVTRPARTGLQGTAGWLLATLIDTFVALDKDQFFALAAVLTLFIGWVQTVVEDYTGRAVLRQVPPTTAPVVD